MDITPIFLQIPPEEIVTLQFLLETYEGLGILRTLDPVRGEVVILALADTLCTVNDLLDSARFAPQMKRIEKPESLAKDWLLGETE